MKKNRVSSFFLLSSAIATVLFYAFPADAADGPILEKTTPAFVKTAVSSLSDSEKKWLEKKQTVRVRVADTPPYQIRNPKASGIALDYIERAARDLGFDLRFVTDDIQFNTALTDISGEHDIYDLILTIKRTPDREKLLCFTDDYIFIPWVIVSRKNDPIHSADDLENKTLALVKGYAVNDIIQQTYSHINLIEKTKPAEALYAVATSGADAYIGDLSIVNYLIKKQGLHNLKITAGTPFGNHNQAMGVRKDWPELASMLSKYFRTMTYEDHLAIFDRWVNISDIPMNLPYTQVPLTMEEHKWIEAHPEVTFGGGPFPPFDYTDKNGRITGISVEYITLLGNMLGIHFKFVTGEWPDMQQRVRDHDIDGLRAIIPKEDNTDALNYTDPYAVVQHCILMHKSARPASTLKELSQAKVGTVKGTLIQSIIEEKYLDITLATYKDFDNALDDLVAGKVDAVVGPLPILSWLMDTMYISDIVVTGLPPEIKKTAHMGIRNDWPELVTILNKAMLKVSREQFRNMTQKWISADLSPNKKAIVLTMEEKKWLKLHPVIRVGANPNREPVEFFDPNGNFKGISADYLEKIGALLGVRFDIVKIRNSQSVKDALDYHSPDMLSCAEETLEDTSKFLFTTPYMTSALAIFNRPNMPFVGHLTGLNGQKVAIIQGDAIREKLAREYPEIIPVPAQDIGEAMDMLGHDADVFLGCPFMVSHYIMMHGESLVKIVGETPYTYQPAMACRSDWPVFAGILQKALDSIPAEDKKTIYSKWVSVQKERVFDYSVFWKIAGSAFLIISLIMIWNRRLKFEVKKQVTTIRNNEIFLNKLLETIPSPVFYKDSEGRYLGINKAFENFSGLTRDQITGRTVFDIYPRELAVIYAEKDRELFLAGGEQKYEFQINNASGSLRDVICNKALMKNDQNDVAGLIGSFVDITELKQIMSALKESEERLQVIFDSAPQTMILLNEDLDIIKINQTGIRLSGNTRSLPPGSRIGNIINCSTAAKSGCGNEGTCDVCDFCKTIKNTFKNNQNHYNVEAIVKPYDSLKRSEKIFLISTSVVKSESPKSILIIMDDITEFRTMENHLMQAQKMDALGTLAGGIAHDFNNILSIILGYTEMSLEDIDPSSDIHANLEKIFASSQQAKELVRQILTYSRQSKKELKPILVQAILKEALKLLHASIPSTIEIKDGIDPSCQKVLADATQIHQIVMNLCTNAYHAMRESGGILEISLNQVYLTEDIIHLGMNLSPGIYLDLKISDTGCGISKEQIKKIFEPYFTTKPKEQGTGLGLAIVHAIVRNYSGDIYVYSEPGLGSTFHVYLPVTEETDSGLASEAEHNTLPKGTERILLVDDDEKIVAMQKKMLEDLGYKITTAKESVTALATFKKNPDDFDMVITDMTMPGMTGDKLAQHILSVKPDVPIVLCTGYSDLITEKKARDMGIRQFLMKPVNRKQLAGKVRALLDSQS